MKQLNRKFKLELDFNESALTASLPNGSIIYLVGVDSSEDDSSKLLGSQYAGIAIDEAASFSVDLRELVYGTLSALVYRYNDRNDYANLPTFHTGQWHYSLGVDLGWTDDTASPWSATMTTTARSSSSPSRRPASTSPTWRAK